MSDIQHLKTFYEDDTDYENKKNIHSPPNEFIMLSKYEDSLDTSNRKLYSDSTSIVSSSSDNDSISEIDSFRSNFRLKMVNDYNNINNKQKCILILDKIIP